MEEASIEQYENWSKEALIAKIQQLETKSKKHFSKPRKQRPFDFSQYKARHVAFKILYLGESYHGFTTASDQDNLPTIESFLFKALMTSKLIPSPQGCGWSRCGRTDKGVSAFGQVVSCWVRTTSNEGFQLNWDQVAILHQKKYVDQQEFIKNLMDTYQPCEPHKESSEIDYLTCINR